VRHLGEESADGVEPTEAHQLISRANPDHVRAVFGEGGKAAALSGLDTSTSTIMTLRDIVSSTIKYLQKLLF
jgi:hypothetical protein